MSRRVLVLNSQFSRGGGIIRSVFIVSFKSMFLDCTITVSGSKNQADLCIIQMTRCIAMLSILGHKSCSYANARLNFARPNTDEESEAFLHAHLALGLALTSVQNQIYPKFRQIANLMARAGYHHLLAPASETTCV